jgi:hypothetical protein
MAAFWAGSLDARIVSVDDLDMIHQLALTRAQGTAMMWNSRTAIRSLHSKHFPGNPGSMNEHIICDVSGDLTCGVDFSVDVVNDEDLNVNLLLQRHEPCFLVLVSP